jgi:hypothetical protein
VFSSNDFLPSKGIDSLFFVNSIRQPNATLFNKMLTEGLESEEYAAAFKTKGPGDSSESLFMALFQQQKLISKIIKEISATRDNLNDSPIK